MEDEKQKRLERSQRFGVDTPATLQDKVKERQERFKNAQQGPETSEDKEKRAQRLARFGPVEAENQEKKKKRGALEFTLDEYKIKDKAAFPGRNKKFDKNN